MKYYIKPEYEDIESLFITSPIGIFDNEDKHIFEFGELIKNIFQATDILNLKVICLDTYSKLETEEFIANLNISNISVELIVMPFSDIWIRDYFSCGTAIDENDNKVLLKAIYSPSYNPDFAIIDELAGIELAKNYSPSSYLAIPFKLDGGNFIANEEYIITTEKIYLENYDIASKQQIDDYFYKNFKQKLIILPIESLDVIGHIDSICRFLDNRTLVLAYYDDFGLDSKYVIKIKNQLQKELGIEYKIILLPCFLSDNINEDNIFSAEGVFVNYLKINNTLIIPSFIGLEEYQREIKDIFKREKPELNIIFSPCDSYAFEGGCFNCITNQIYK